MDRIVLNFSVQCEHCGNDIHRRKIIKRGKTRGQTRGIRFCSPRCRNLGRGPGKGYIHHTGYRIISCGKRGKQMPEHRFVMEKMIGRKLTRQETVHHKNGDRLDNRPENLELWTGRHGRGVRVADMRKMATYAEHYTPL